MVYKTILATLNDQHVHEAGVVPATRENFNVSAIQLTKKIKSNGKSHRFWLLLSRPPQFRFIDDRHFVSKEDVPPERFRRKAQSGKVKFNKLETFGVD